MTDDTFDYELECGHCGTTLGTFVQGDDFAAEPHSCPVCHSRHLTQQAVTLRPEWKDWSLPESGEGGATRIRFLLESVESEPEEEPEANRTRRLEPRWHAPPRSPGRRVA